MGRAETWRRPGSIQEPFEINRRLIWLVGLSGEEGVGGGWLVRDIRLPCIASASRTLLHYCCIYRQPVGREEDNPKKKKKKKKKKSKPMMLSCSLLKIIPIHDSLLLSHSLHGRRPP